MGGGGGGEDMDMLQSSSCFPFATKSKFQVSTSSTRLNNPSLQKR